MYLLQLIFNYQQPNNPSLRKGSGGAAKAAPNPRYSDFVQEFEQMAEWEQAVKLVRREVVRQLEPSSSAEGADAMPDAMPDACPWYSKPKGVKGERPVDLASKGEGPGKRGESEVSEQKVCVMFLADVWQVFLIVEQF